MTTSVDIVVPCVPKHIRHLRALITSIRANTWQPDHIIIALSQTNAAECDRVGVALRRLACPTPVVMTCVTTTAYAAENRNRGAAVSDADVLMFIDADDAMFPNAIATTMEVMRAHRADAVYHGFSRDPAYSESPMEARAPTVDPASFAKLEKADRSDIGLRRIPIHHGHVTVRRTVYLNVGGQSEAKRWRRAEDSKFMRDLCRSGYRVAFTPRKLTLYNEHLSAEGPNIIVRRAVLTSLLVLIVVGLAWRRQCRRPTPPHR